MASATLRIGIAGGGHAARVHLERLLAHERVQVVGVADSDLDAARDLAAHVPPREGAGSPAVFADHRELIRRLTPDALAIFTPHLAHYRAAMDALQAGCHLFIEKPLSTNVQEAADVAGLARARERKVAVGHQYRLRPGLAEARRRLAGGAIGPVRLVTGVLALPWRAARGGAEHAWRSEPAVAGGIVADVGDHLLDALLWTTGQVAVEAAAVRGRPGAGPDVAAAAAIRLADGTSVTLAFSGASPGTAFELNYYGENGRLRVTDETLEEQAGDTPPRPVPLPEATETIDGNFVGALLDGTPLCCPVDEALDTVRLLEAVVRAAATGQVVRLA
jgi:predicted dehydrogenase